MSANFSNEEIRSFSGDDFPYYFLYQYLPLPTEKAGFISSGGILLEDPLSLDKFQVGYQVETQHPTTRTWEVMKVEVYNGSEENICSGVIICWCKEVF